MRSPETKTLLATAARLGVAVTATRTLAGYGLTPRDWLLMAHDQNWRCPICDRQPSRFVVDHEHVAGWKKMPPERRALYVRGLVCWTCNYYLLARDISPDTADRIGLYLRRYSARRP